MTVVFIKGLGLIGSSLARIIKAGHPDCQIIASDTELTNLEFAQSHGFIDQGAAGWRPAEAADFIILATPVSQINRDLTALATLPLKKGVIVTDVGSTKQSVVKAARGLTKRGINFVGGHPMAGSHLTGAAAGRADLFAGAYYFLVPCSSSSAAVDQLRSLLAAASVRWTTITATAHDRLVAQLSHLPHLLAYTLVNQTAQTLAGQQPGMEAAAGGFKSVTRTAQAEPAMWTAIMKSNREQVLGQLADFQQQLTAVQQALSAGNYEWLNDFFTRAAIIRQHLN